MTKQEEWGSPNLLRCRVFAERVGYSTTQLQLLLLLTNCESCSSTKVDSITILKNSYSYSVRVNKTTIPRVHVNDGPSRPAVIMPAADFGVGSADCLRLAVQHHITYTLAPTKSEHGLIQLNHLRCRVAVSIRPVRSTLATLWWRRYFRVLRPSRLVETGPLKSWPSAM